MLTPTLIKTLIWTLIMTLIIQVFYSLYDWTFPPYPKLCPWHILRYYQYRTSYGVKGGKVQLFNLFD